MDKIFTALRTWIARLLETDATPSYLDSLSIRDYADFPVTHPAGDIR